MEKITGSLLGSSPVHVDDQPLNSSGAWGDSPSPEPFPLIPAPVKVEKQTVLALEPIQNPISPEEQDRFSAPTFWLKNSFGMEPETFREALIKAFSSAGQPNVDVADMFFSTNGTRSHAYFVLNSEKASRLLIDGTVNIVVSIPKRKRLHAGSGSDEENGDDREELVLWLEKANPFGPAEHQDPFTLYVWNLPLDKPASEIEDALREKISILSPISSLTVAENDDGLCGGWARVGFDYEFDTQKCVYMLNFRPFYGNLIRASFYNMDREKPKRAGGKPRPSNNQKSRAVKEKRPPKNNTFKPKAAPVPAPASKASDEWSVVPRRRK